MYTVGYMIFFFIRNKYEIVFNNFNIAENVFCKKNNENFINFLKVGLEPRNGESKSNLRLRITVEFKVGVEVDN